MPDNQPSKKLSSSDYIEDLIKNLSEERHKRIIRAFKDENPVGSMEAELGAIVMEIVNRAD